MSGDKVGTKPSTAKSPATNSPHKNLQRVERSESEELAASKAAQRRPDFGIFKVLRVHCPLCTSPPWRGAHVTSPLRISV